MSENQQNIDHSQISILMGVLQVALKVSTKRSIAILALVVNGLLAAYTIYSGVTPSSVALIGVIGVVGWLISKGES